MLSQRHDFILQQIELLRQFVTRLVNDYQPARSDEALRLALGLQERLFPLPVAEFLQLDAAAQFTALRRQPSPSDALETCLTYVELLVHTATLYELRGRDDLASGARQLALHLALLAYHDEPTTAAASLVPLLRTLLGTEPIHPPVQELLAAFDAATT